MIQKARLSASVKGRVQGVFYRVFVENSAQSLGLTGYVKNLPGGDVQVLAEGEKGHLERLLQLLHKGPASAKVEAVNFHWEDYKGNFREFTIRY